MRYRVLLGMRRFISRGPQGFGSVSQELLPIFLISDASVPGRRGCIQPLLIALQGLTGPGSERTKRSDNS